MRITAKHLNAEAKRLQAKRDQLLADLNGIIGAQQAIENMQARLRLKKEPKPAAPTAPRA